MATAITGLEFDQTATRHVLEDVERKVEDNRKATEDLTSELDLRFNVAVSDVEAMLIESEDRIVDKIVAKLVEREQRSLFSAKVRKATAELDDSGMATSPFKESVVGASTPKEARSFEFPVKGLDKVNRELRKEVEEQQNRIRWLETIVDEAKDIRRRNDIVE